MTYKWLEFQVKTKVLATTSHFACRRCSMQVKLGDWLFFLLSLFLSPVTLVVNAAEHADKATYVYGMLLGTFFLSTDSHCYPRAGTLWISGSRSVLLVPLVVCSRSFCSFQESTGGRGWRGHYLMRIIEEVTDRHADTHTVFLSHWHNCHITFPGWLLKFGFLRAKVFLVFYLRHMFDVRPCLLLTLCDSPVH